MKIIDLIKIEELAVIVKCDDETIRQVVIVDQRTKDAMLECIETYEGTIKVKDTVISGLKFREGYI